MLLPLPVQNSITETGMARQIRKKSGTGIYHVMYRSGTVSDLFQLKKVRKDATVFK